VSTRKIDDPVGEALAALPRESAGPGFTARVLARVAAADETAERRRGAPALGAALGALATAAVAALVAALLVRTTPPTPGTDPAVAEGPAATAAPDPVAAAGGQGGAPEAGGAGGGRREPAAIPAPAAAGSPEAVGAPPDRLAAASAGAPTGPARERRPARLAAAPEPDSLAEARAALAELRRRHRQFETALAELPEPAADGWPKLYFGGDEGLEFVLDLGRAEVEPYPILPAGDRSGRRPRRR
jgi:hypothetical protein